MHCLLMLFLFHQIISFAEADASLHPAIHLQKSDDVLRVELATCVADLDPSLFDRVHRTVDALEALQQTSPIILRAITDAADIRTWDNSSSRVCRWFGEDRDRGLGRDRRKSPKTLSNRHHRGGSNLTPIEITCASLRTVIRIPIPLESVPPFPGEDLAQIRKRLWTRTGSGQECLLTWWKPCLRPESLAINLVNLVAKFRHPPEHPPGVSSYQLEFTQLEGSFVSSSYELVSLVWGATDCLDSISAGLRPFFTGGATNDSKPFLVLSKSSSNREAASVSLRIAPDGRRRLNAFPVKGHSRPCRSTAFLTRKTVTVVQSDESSSAMSSGLNDYSSPSSIEPPSQDEEIEENLIANVITHTQRSPFVRRAMFLGEDSQNLWDKQSLLPGDSKHLKTYNFAASRQCKYLVALSLPDVLFRVPDERALSLLYTRLLIDLTLWKSLLPSNRRSRAVLLVGGGVQPSFGVSDHRYWFYAEPVPPGSIYAHPSAALAAEERHRRYAEGLLPSSTESSSSSSSSAESDTDALNTPFGAKLGEQYDLEGIYSANQAFQSPAASFLSVSIEHFETRIRLNTSQRPPSSIPMTFILASHSVRLTTEVNPCGKSGLAYTTLTCGQIEGHVSGSFDGNNKFSGSSTSSQSKISIPLLLPIIHSEDVSTEPMLALAMEKQSIPIYGPLEPLSPSCSEDIVVAVKLRLGCLCYWPYLHTWWMEAFPNLQSNLMSKEYPSLFCPSYNVKIHWHLDNSAVHVPPVCAFEGIIDGEKVEEEETISINLAPPTSGLGSLRPLILTKSVTAFSKFTNTTSHITFFERLALWLVPTPSSLCSAKKSQRLRLPSGEQQGGLPRAIWREVKALKCLLSDDLDTILRRSVKVIDVDHLELHFVSSDGSQTPSPPRMDVRLTINLIRLTTCLDSLVALRLILEGFNRTPQSLSPKKKPSGLPVLINPPPPPPPGDEASRRSKIEGLISAAVSDVDVSNCSPLLPPPPPPQCLATTHSEEDFVVIERGSPKTPPSPRQPAKVLEDGTRIMSYSPASLPNEDFYAENRCLPPLPRRQGLFSDPFGSESLFAFTLHDVSVEWTFFGGLDFPSMCSGTDMEEKLRQSLSIPHGLALSHFSRQNDQTATVRLSNVYFRKSIFKPSVEYQLHRYRTGSKEMRRQSSPLSIASTSTLHPVTRYALRIGDVKIVDGLPQSMINHLFHVQQSRAREDGRFVEAVRATVLMWPSLTSLAVPTDYEAEVKVSIQPLQINLDQTMFVFLRAHHTALTQLTERYLQDMEKRVSLLFCLRSVSVEGEEEQSTLRSATTSTNDEDQPIFFKQLTIIPSLPIRFNYHGHQLDLSQGTFIGLLALCLRLKNAELVLPQWVYQRGYRGVYCLMEEVVSHWTSTLQNNLFQILATSIGPMNEISSIREFSSSLLLVMNVIWCQMYGFLAVVGVRDFVLHSVNAFVTPVRSLRGDRHQPPHPSSDQVVQDLRIGVRALSENAVWPIVELSTEGVRTAQYLFEVRYLGAQIPTFPPYSSPFESFSYDGQKINRVGWIVYIGLGLVDGRIMNAELVLIFS
ncbi:unnamed protein product [Hydatigera taeniaeformis]|uniref:Autophagy-related protein 2 n=1 Tax=Hydatigena taeniaeformis TaxID=6205 RepID=A0A0R3X5L8_HYDTA|nr:unnamed protein product [Hydatigera taeniaeformis]